VTTSERRPRPSTENARRTMQANRRVSRRELELRAAVRRSGTGGYRVNAKLPGRPDMVFPGVRLAVFFHGCFWHRCPTCDLPSPRANRDFWAAKFAENAARDDRVIAELASLGWEALVIWEHEVRSDAEAAASVVSHAVAERRTRTHVPDLTTTGRSRA
jgi:DNA mismatch endonuclease (patch repair protein)